MEVRPKLKHNALFIQTEHGLLVTGEGPSFHIKGKSIPRWISTLKPYLNGDYTLDQLCAKLDPAQREHMVRLIEMLMQKGILKNHIPEATDLLSASIQKRFQSQLEYIEHFVDSPQKRFRQFRDSAIVLYGAGEILLSMALFLLHNGLKELSLIVTDSVDSYRATLEPEVTLLCQSDCEIKITIIAGNFATIQETLKNTAVVVYCSDQGSLQEIATLNQQCIHHGRLFLSVTPLPGQMMLGPLVQAGQGPCWLCAMMRLSANSDYQMQASLWQKITLGESIIAVDEIFSRPLARRIGQGLGFELFKHLTQCLSGETTNGVLFQHLDTLESSHSTLLQHPRCPVCSHLNSESVIHRLAEVISGERDDKRSEAEIYAQNQRLFDARLGIFRGFVDDTIEQIPLKRSHISGGSPDQFMHQAMQASGFSLDSPLLARMQTLKNALGAYCAYLPDKRAMLFASQRELMVQEKVVIPAQEFSTWAGILPCGLDDKVAWLPGYSSSKHEFVLLPAAIAYPSSYLNRPGIFEQTTLGTTVATTFAEAFMGGLFSALEWECQQAIAQGHSTFLTLNSDNIEASDPTDEDLHFLAQSARRFARPFVLHEVIWDLPIATIIASTIDEAPSTIITMGIELAGTQALKVALQKLVEKLQQQADSYPSHATATDDLSFLFNAPHMYTTNPSLRRPEVTLKQIENTFQQAGRDIIFVQMASDDIWHASTLISGKVLLTRSLTARER
jgi:bacteriocin biosynthesis cyclodehydratase domain-containing protein